MCSNALLSPGTKQVFFRNAWHLCFTGPLVYNLQIFIVIFSPVYRSVWIDCVHISSSRSFKGWVCKVWPGKMLGLQRVLLAFSLQNVQIYHIECIEVGCSHRPHTTTFLHFYFWHTFDTASQTQCHWCLTIAVYIKTIEKTDGHKQKVSYVNDP